MQSKHQRVCGPLCQPLSSWSSILVLYSNHSSLDICSPHAAAESFQDLSRRNNCGFWHKLLTWSIVVNALHAGGSYTGKVCGASIRLIVPVISGLVLVAVFVVQEGILCRPFHICHTGFCRQEIHMCIQEVLNKRGVHQSQKSRLLLQYSTHHLPDICLEDLCAPRHFGSVSMPVRLCCAMPSIR